MVSQTANATALLKGSGSACNSNVLVKGLVKERPL